MAEESRERQRRLTLMAADDPDGLVEHVKDMVSTIARENRLEFCFLPIDNSLFRKYETLEIIRHSQLVIFDLSARVDRDRLARTDAANYGLGYLVGSGRPVILIENESSMPFDIKSIASVTFSASALLDRDRGKKIYFQLSNTVRLALNDPTQFVLSHIQTKSMRVFVSYARVDKMLLDRLRPYLRTLELISNITVFIDESIEHGQAWRARLDEELAGCHCALLLLTGDLFCSEFVSTVELPAIEKRHAAGALSLYPLVGSAPGQDAKYRDFLSRYQTINPPTLPLDVATEIELQGVALDLLTRLAKERTALERAGLI